MCSYFDWNDHIANLKYCMQCHGTYIACIEAYLENVFKITERLMTENIKSVTPKQEAVDDFQEHKDTIAKDLSWTSTCRSW